MSLSLVFYTELYWHIHQCWHCVSVTLANFGHMNNSLRLTQESEEQSLKSSGITSWSCSISQLGPTIWIVWWHSRLFSTDVGPFLLVQRTFMIEIRFECKTANRYSTELNWTPRYFFDMGANEEMGYWSQSGFSFELIHFMFMHINWIIHDKSVDFYQLNVI